VAAALTHQDMAIKLVVEGALRIVRGQKPAQMPIEALPLTDEEKEKAGANPKALVVFYPVGDTGVFLQMLGHQARVWFTGADCDGVVAKLEQAINTAYPGSTFNEEKPHMFAPKTNVRLYNVPVDDKRFATVEATYPIDREAKQQFAVRVYALERT
jgi:hypothetical protein